MNYEQFENDIVSQLQDKCPAGVDVVAFPESNEELVKPFEGAHISVMYKGSRFGDPGGNNWMRSTGQISQLEILQADIVLRSRFLRGAAHSCLQLVATIRKALTGFRPSDCDRMYATRWDMVIPNTEEPGDIFTYVLTFEATTLNVEDYDDTADDIGLISKIQMTSNYG